MRIARDRSAARRALDDATLSFRETRCDDDSTVGGFAGRTSSTYAVSR
jgi:hypothetical protein